QALTQDDVFAQSFLYHHQVIETSNPSLERETILLALVAQLFQRNGVSIKSSDAAERDAVKRIKKKLEDDFDKNIPLEDLAKLVDLDPLYMIRVFKKNVGISPHSYQIQKRIAHVQNLLRKGASIAQASFCCGFFDQSHMTRAFKRVVGVTPGSFRNSR
ncbi:MAG: AraC family transcriptional regulator, partial [Pseudomonas sp.]|nr:AraC family transcriptional regulator [Pseudomonas sp.]